MKCKECGHKLIEHLGINYSGYDPHGYCTGDGFDEMLHHICQCKQFVD